MTEAGMALAAQGIIAGVQGITRGGPRRQYKWNKRAMMDANQVNRDNALWTLEQNRKIQNEQRVYDSPASQMARYREAGLNPHLIYGNGSSAGGAFPIDQGSIAPARLDAPSSSYPDVVGSFLQSGQALAQTELTREKAAMSELDQALRSVQIDIAKTNPMLDESVYRSVVASMTAVAEAKASEARVNWMVREETTEHGFRRYTLGERKAEAEVEALVQRLGLNTEDLKIKNAILTSKEFENAIKEVQKKWLQDSEISPEHIRQGLMLILSKMVGR